MSIRVITSPSTPRGIDLGMQNDFIVPHFHIHECGFSSRIDNWNWPAMTCPFWCLWHMMGDGSWIESDGSRWDVGADCVVLKPAHIIHSLHSRKAAPQLWLHFSLLHDYAFTASAPFKIPLNQLLHQQLSSLIDAYGAAAQMGKGPVYHYAAALLNSCFALHPLPLRIMPDTLQRVLQRIDSAPASDLSNASLARLASISISSFIHLFELHMHQPPATYVREVRFQKASKRLIFSDLSIEQVAAETGYPNRHHFSREFARRAGCGPATFRKRHKK